MDAETCKKINGIWDSKRKTCFHLYKTAQSKQEVKEAVDLLTFVFIGTCGGKYRKAKEGYNVYARHWV